MIAAFFSVVQDDECDAAIFRFNYERTALTNKNPFEFKTVTVYKPPSITKRIIAQQGVFTIHPNPSESFSKAPAKGKLEKIIIDKNYRKKFKFELHRYGFNHLSVFQDLQGLTEYIEWRWLNRE